MTHVVLSNGVGFTYTLEFTILPSSDVAAGEQKVFDIGATSQGNITFASTGNFAASVEAAILNLLRPFVLADMFPRFRRRLESGINAAVLQSIAGLIAPGTTTMPAGIVFSARTVVTKSTGLTVRATLGVFGGVFSKLPKPGPAPNPNCFIATAAYGSPQAPEVDFLSADPSTPAA